MEIPLLKGKYKEQPNNPKRPDGSIHEYCPPIHVDSEMGNLLAWASEYSSDDPIIVASWLHHRFTQIHPYQDGNGRVARALTTMVLLKADLLPLVLDRDLRVEYIDALESADLGNLSALAAIFASLERTAILQALSIDADQDLSSPRTLTSAVLNSLAEKLSRRKEQQVAELRHVNVLAKQLRAQAKMDLQQSFHEMESAVVEIGIPDSSLQEGGIDYENAHWYKSEVLIFAKDSGKFANFAEDHYFLEASIRVKREKLSFVVSFHHVGRELTGIMEATAFSNVESNEGSGDRWTFDKKFFLCSVEPFVFTHQTKIEQIDGAFNRWLDQAFAVAVKEFGDRL